MVSIFPFQLRRFACLIAASLAVSGAADPEPMRAHVAALRFEFPGNAGSRTHWAAVRTEQGRMIASGSGLIEFAGGSWRQLTREGDFDWEALGADREGRIWAAALDEIGVYEPDASGVLRYRSLTPLLPEAERDLGDIWSVFPRVEGVIFVGRERVVRTDGLSAVSWQIPAWRRLYAWEEHGEIYIGAKEGRVLRMTASGPVPAVIPGIFTESAIGWAVDLGSEGWLAYTESGLVSSSPAKAGVLTRINQVLRRSAPVSAMRVPDGRLAIGTFTGGLFLVDLDTGRFEQLDDQSGLPSNSVTGLLPGGRDWLWAVTTRGLSRVSLSRAITVARSESGLDASVIRFVARVGNSVIIATDAGRYVLSDDGVSRTFGKLNNSWYSTHARSGDTLLCGAMTGLYRMTAERAERLVEESSDVVAIVPSTREPGLIYYATATAVRAAQWREGEIGVVASIGMKRQIDSMVEDADGSLWVAAGSAVYRVSFAADHQLFVIQGEFSLPGRETGASGGATLMNAGGSVLALASGTLMELKSGGGTFAPVKGLENVEFKGIATTAGGDVWALARPVRHKSGLARLVRLRLEAGEFAVEEVGLPGLHTLGELSSLHVVEGGAAGSELWLGARDGIVQVDPARVGPAGPPPPVVVELARLADGVEEAASSQVAEFPFNHGAFVFRWSSPDVVPGELMVETRLAGAEAEWSPAGERQSREFARLADGSYEFQVRTVDVLGRPGPVASKVFAVLPPWYRTPWAISGICAFLLLAGALSWQMRLRVARRRAEELEELVDTRTRELARVNAEMTRFIARMNHEIRNPLNGLLGAVGILEQFAHTGREGRMMQILRACADHLGAVVEDVLDFTNIEGGRIVVQDRAFSVAEMVEAVPRMMLAEADRTGTEVVTTILPDVPSVVVADPDRIRQILVNFLGNALKYAPGEPVHIEVAATAVDEAPWLRFAVRDHGPGISETDKQNLFKMFERGRGPAKRKVRGMGIGLATCRLLARRMGGEVGVISGLGEGSEFFLKLPLKVEAGAVVQPDRLPRAELRGLACLIVEDQEFNRVILRDMLERNGCSVDEAADAETALSLAAMNRYDFVFTDLELPDAAPGEILKMLRERQSTADTPVPALVVTTAYATENVRQTCLGAGAAAFLAKPLSSSKLLAVLREIDSARRPAASVESAAHEPVRETSAGMIHHLARIRGCSVRDVVAEIAGNIDDEVRQLQAGVRLANSRDVGQRAHRLLSLAAMADAPELAGVAAGIQSDAHQGRMPTASRLDALLSAMASAREKLSSLTFDVSAGARSRAPGHSGPTASSHSD